MKYVLRNQDKIGSVYGSLVMHRMIKSLNAAINDDIEFFRAEGDQFDSFVVNDVGHTVNMIAFYVIRKTFDVYTVAFKEFIG